MTVKMSNQIQRSARAALVAQSVEDLNRRGAAFIQNFDRQESRMVEIAREFDSIAAKVEKIIEEGDKVAKVGVITLATGLGVAALGLAAAPFTGGASAVAAVGGVAAVVGGAVAITAKVVQFLDESGSAKELQKLGNEFMRIARPLNEELKEIKARAKELQVDVADCYLAEKVRRVEDSLRLVEDASDAIEEAIVFINSLVQLILKLLMRIATNKEEEDLTKKVVKSGKQCWKIINHFREIKEDLQGFKANIAIC